MQNLTLRAKLVLLIGLYSKLAVAAEGSGLEIFAAGDMVYTHDYAGESESSNKLGLRSAEVSLFGSRC